MARDWNPMKKLLPNLGDDPTYADVLKAARELHSSKSLQELSSLIREQMVIVNEHKEILSRHNLIAAVCETILIERLEAMDLESVKLSTGQTWRIDRTEDARVLEGQQGNVVAWFKNNGMESLLSVHGQRLSKIARDRSDAGEALPDGIELVPRNKLAGPGLKGLKRLNGGDDSDSDE